MKGENASPKDMNPDRLRLVGAVDVFGESACCE